MTPEPGRRLLHFRLVEKIGAGGMGEVWRASDETLGREVAIKILPAAVAGEGDRLARFEREARVLATLNHPNIAAIYGLHHAEDVHFLVLELVHGEDLSERLRRGPLETATALEVADRLAAALEYAHERGVIHRDLKPANVKRAPDGTIKVLDFGLAKAVESDEPGRPHDLSKSPTVTSAGTMAGTILGTAAYMSPEQARGKPVDKRSDVWAFGCVVYEMLAGRSAFEGETVTDILASVVRSEPDWAALPEDVPPGAVAVLRRCLRKDARERLRDVGDARLLIKEAAESGAGHADVAAGAPTTGAAAPAASAPGISRGGSRPGAPSAMRHDSRPGDESAAAGAAGASSSRDGAAFGAPASGAGPADPASGAGGFAADSAAIAREGVYPQAASHGGVRPESHPPGSIPPHAAAHSGLARVTAPRGLRGGLLTLALAIALIFGALLGAVGAARMLGGAAARDPLPATRFTAEHPGSQRASISNPVASPDGRFIVYVAREQNVSRLWLRELDQPQARVLPGTEGAAVPFVSPDSRWVGFFAENRLRKVAVSGGTPIDLCDAVSNPGASWGPDGTIVFSLGWTGGLLAVSEDGGESRPLTSLEDVPGGTGHWWPEFLPGGRTLLFTVFPEEGTLNRGRLALLDLDTGASRVVGDGAQALYLPSGHILYHRAGIYELAPFDVKSGEISGAPRQVLENAPYIDPAGTTIRYVSASAAGVLAWIARDDAESAAPRSWFLLSRDGTLEPARLPPDALRQATFSPDGERVIATHLVAGDYDIFVHDLATGSATRVTRESINNNGRWHPDGRRIAFDTIRLGTYDVFLATVDGTGEATPLLTRPGDAFGGSFSADGELMAVQLSSNDTGEDIHLLTVETGELRQLVATDHDEESPAISPDGRLVAYVSDRSGTNEVYVAPTSGESSPVQVSRAGGAEPKWSGDGSWLAYHDSREVLTASIRLAARGVVVEEPQPFVGRDTRGTTATRDAALPATRFAGRFTGEFAVAPDGDHVLLALLDTPLHAEVQLKVGPLEDLAAD